MKNLTTKNDLIILNINGQIKEVYFERWLKKHNNGVFFIATDGNTYNINDSI